MSTPAFSAALQLVLQRPDGGALCEGYTGLPLTHPCYIGIESDGSPHGDRNAVALGREVRRQILAMPGVMQVTPPCGGSGSSFKCFAISRPEARKVAVTVSDGTRPISPPDFSAHGGSNLVCFPQGTDSSKVLPSWLATTAAYAWRTSILEAVPSIFSLVQVAPGLARLFISYRQKEAWELSEQLFVELAKIGFDVFVDRFRGSPGTNFQRRILEEIADKSMVLFLETKTTATAPWTRYEVAVAKSLRVGLLALRLPGGVPIRDIDNGRRVVLAAGDFVAGKQTLDQPKLGAVLARITTDHTLNEVRRRQLLRDSARRAFALAQVHHQQLVHGDMIQVTPVANPKKEYLLSIRSRPATLANFHEVVHANASAPLVRTLLAPAAHVRDVRREQMRWLARLSAVLAFDESRMLRVARQMKAQTL